MALADKKYQDLYDKSGSGKKRMDDAKQARISASFASNVLNEAPESMDAVEALVYQTKLIQEDLDEIRRYLGAEVVSNTATNLSVTAGGTSLTINSSDGTNASIPAATTNAWGAMTDENFDAIAANTAKTGITSAQSGSITTNTSKVSSVGYHITKTANYVWIPGTQFYGEHTALGKNTYITQTGTKSVSAYEWPGIQGKKVTEVKVFTDSAVTSGVNVFRITATNGTAASLGSGNTNADINITDWSCTMGETLKIQVSLKSTSIKIYGVHLVITD